MSKMNIDPSTDIERWHFTPLDAPKEGEFIPPTVEEIAAIEAAAREDGFRQGFQQGFADGQLRLKTITALVTSFEAEMKKLDEAVGLELTTLATEIARKVLTVAFQHDEALVARVVEEALNLLPTTLEPTRVLVNPQDLHVIRDFLGQEFAGRKLTFLEDRSISPGGCKLFTATSDIDGTLETRWARVTTVLEAHPWDGKSLVKELSVTEPSDVKASAETPPMPKPKA